MFEDVQVTRRDLSEHMNIEPVAVVASDMQACVFGVYI